MYCNKKGLARKLSTGQSKNPWISFWCRSIVITWVSPDLHIILAKSLETIHPRLRILHCLLYGRYGMTATIELADDVLQAYAIINSSIILLFTSLKANDFSQTLCVTEVVRTWTRFGWWRCPSREPSHWSRPWFRGWFCGRPSSRPFLRRVAWRSGWQARDGSCRWLLQYPTFSVPP